MSKLPKFLISYSRSGDREFVLHIQEPLFIAEVFITDSEEERMEIERRFASGAHTRYNDQIAVIGVLHFWQDHGTDADKIAGLMRRCADWYHGILKEDIENENNE